MIHLWHIIARSNEQYAFFLLNRTFLVLDLS